MKFIAFADLHLSSRPVLGRPRLPVGANFLADVLHLCRQYDVQQVVALGDSIDSKHDFAALMLLHRFCMAAKQAGVSFLCLGGNHENREKTDPTNSVLAVLSGVADVALLPSVRRWDGVTVLTAPWAPESAFIENCERLAALAQETTGRKILLAHVGVKEGRIGASNITLPQRVSVSSLYPSLYDLVLLGDYHVHQQVAENVYYLGAPYQHHFGDEGTVGPWLVDTDTCKMESLPLVQVPPRFQQWRISDDRDLRVDGYTDRDYNRIHSNGELAEVLRLRYPEADIRLIREEITADPDLSESRLSAANSADPAAMIGRYLDTLGIAEDRDLLHGIGCRLIEEARKG